METTLKTPESYGVLVPIGIPIAAVMFCVASALGSDRAKPEAANPIPPEAVLASFSELKDPLVGFDWQEEAGRLRRAAENLWQRNGWDDEPDRFAREVACEVTAIPPWDVAARLNLLTTRISQRYGLTEEEASRFRLSLLREVGLLIMRHGPAMLEKGREVLAARVRGEPYSPQQVAEWAKDLEPLLVEGQVSADRLAEEILPSLDAGHKLLLGRDRESFQKRTRYVDAMRARWVEGKWQPTDWGLETDPIQNRAVPLVPTDSSAVIPPEKPSMVLSSSTPEQAAPAPLPQWVSHDPPTWYAYVVEFELRYQLDPGQRITAESIHSEMVERAGNYSMSHRDDLRTVPAQERASHAIYDPIRAMFYELQTRLDALPTTAQYETHKP